MIRAFLCYAALALFLINPITVFGGIDGGQEQNTPKKKALIFGITGQDGHYLTEFLLQKNYEVHGVRRPSSTSNVSRLKKFFTDPQYSDNRPILHVGDICCTSMVLELVQRIQPDEIYNLAAQSHVHLSFFLPVQTAEIDGLGTLKILEAIRQAGLEKKTKFYQASTSEMFGNAKESPQSEETPFHPRSPYGVAKLFAYWITVNYREAYGLYACNGILFNHESPKRGKDFSTRKITLAVARCSCGSDEILFLGNLDAQRDWGYAKEYVEAMWLMLQQEQPDDYVVGMGESHSVREFTEEAFKVVGIDIHWQGEGADEEGIDQASGRVIVKIDPQLYRPADIELLAANPAKAFKKLHWQPKTTFQELVKIMVLADLELAKKEMNSVTPSNP